MLGSEVQTLPQPGAGWCGTSARGTAAHSQKELTLHRERYLMWRRGALSRAASACSPTSPLLPKRSPSSEQMQDSSLCDHGQEGLSLRLPGQEGVCADLRGRPQAPAPSSFALSKPLGGSHGWWHPCGHAQCGGAGACTSPPPPSLLAVSLLCACNPGPQQAGQTISRQGGCTAGPHFRRPGQPAPSPPGVLRYSLKIGRESPGYDYVLLQTRTCTKLECVNAGCASSQGRCEWEEEAGPDPGRWQPTPLRG